MRGFVNRTDEFQELNTVLIGGDGDPHVISVYVIAGTAGVGKTSLALRWATRSRIAFPTGSSTSISVVTTRANRSPPMRPYTVSWSLSVSAPIPCRRTSTVHHELGDTWHEALALDGLGAALLDEDPEAADRHWTMALGLLADYDDPRAVAIRTRIESRVTGDGREPSPARVARCRSVAGRGRPLPSHVTNPATSTIIPGILAAHG
ncbi:hypothetical protein [Streptosporangium sp. NPDC000509]|uniref:hypothetical protein n=1 Tax=Streptosporangium sp. NPDC000509 TaxID=3366186 RepID=UPI00367F73ED